MIIKTKQLSFKYQASVILDKINLEADPRLTVIIGPNAAGKSTLISCLAGLLKPAGAIFFNGDEIGQLDRKTLSETVSYLQQHDNSRSMLTVFETVLLGRLSKLSLVPGDKDLEAVYITLQRLKLEHLAARPLCEMSGGQRQLVFIAQALVKKPRILLMDEPTNNLDLARQLDMFYLIRQLTDEASLTTIMALHDLNFASRFGDRLVVLNQGRIHSIGPPKKVINLQMLHDVYGIKANIVLDECGIPQIIPIESLSSAIDNQAACNTGGGNACRTSSITDDELTSLKN